MAFRDFIGVDWGTSSFRAWHCQDNGKKYRLLTKSDQGMSKLSQKDFAPYLERILRENRIPQTLPVLICGMAGARGGWHEADYAIAPAGHSKVAKGAVAVHAGGYACRILPGVSFSENDRFDVMRGEETLIFGALNQGAGDGLYCLPGTHSKWCWIEGGKLQRWQTVMTGELFALLSTQSTLCGFCQSVSANIHTKPEFSDAIRDVLDGNRSALRELFAIRARALLDPKADILDFAARLSGLLIGQEIADLKTDDVKEVTLISTGPISEVYCTALEIAGMEVRTLDSEKTVLAGLALFAATIFEGDDLREEVR